VGASLLANSIDREQARSHEGAVVGASLLANENSHEGAVVGASLLANENSGYIERDGNEMRRAAAEHEQVPHAVKMAHALVQDVEDDAARI
jgi:hypothetical protein